MLRGRLSIGHRGEEIRPTTPVPTLVSSCLPRRGKHCSPLQSGISNFFFSNVQLRYRLRAMPLENGRESFHLSWAN